MEIYRNYESIIITVISNIIVLVSHNVFCLGHFMPMSYGVNEKTLPIVSLPPFDLSRFSPSLFVVLQGILYQPFFVLIRLLPKIIHFQSKAISFFQLIAGRFWFCCFVYMRFLGQFFTVLTRKKLHDKINNIAF